MMPISSSILDKVGTIQNDKMTNVILRRKPKDLYGILLRQPADQNDNAVVNFVPHNKERSDYIVRGSREINPRVVSNNEPRYYAGSRKIYSFHSLFFGTF